MLTIFIVANTISNPLCNSDCHIAVSSNVHYNDGVTPYGRLLEDLNDFILPVPTTTNGCSTINMKWKTDYHIFGTNGVTHDSIIINSSSSQLRCGTSKMYCIPLRSSQSTTFNDTTNDICFEIDSICVIGSFVFFRI